MLKRRDWLHVHGKTGGGTDSDSDSAESSGAGEEPEATSSDDGSDVEAGQVESPHGVQNTESSDAEEDEDEGSIAVLETIKESWSSATPQISKGLALRCCACGTLLLNAVAYRQHTASKRHKAKVRLLPDGEDGIQFATDFQAEPAEAEETHAERLARIRALAANEDTKPTKQVAKPVVAAAAGERAGSAEHKDKSKRPHKRHKKSKLGKRQRAALKAASQ